jgi:hypothetical protein
MSFDELYDDILHDEFRSAPIGGEAAHGMHAARHALGSPSRSRTVALVASGGLACAVVGAFLGGLGGEFGVSPASAHALNSSSDFVPLSSLADAAFHSHSAASPAAVAAAKNEVISTLSGNTVTTLPTTLGGVVKGITAADPASPVLDTSNSPGGISDAVNTTGTQSGSGSPVTDTNPVDGVVSDLSIGLNGVLSNLTAALSGIVSLPNDPTAGLTGVVEPLSGVLTSLSSTLVGLTTVLPVPTQLTTSPILTGAPTSEAPAVTNSSHAPASPVAAVTKTVSGVVNTVTAPVTSVLAPVVGSGSGLPSLPTAPLLPTTSDSPLPSLPVVAPTSSAPILPPVTIPILPTSSTTPPTCTTTPILPSVPLPTVALGTVSLGAVSVGVNVGGTTSTTVCTTS